MVIAFILAFIFRAFVVEPFIIPTGSMAPTMLGAHMQMHCPSCGYSFASGTDASITTDNGALVDAVAADCPMCNYQVVSDVGTRVKSGDRILVDKFSYHLTEPSRWDIIVFKAPKGQDIGGEPAPRTNFIKRLAALPGERVCLLDGNLYVAPAGTDDFHIARKTDPKQNHHWQSIQRAIWQPIYHSQYVPIDNGQATGPGRDSRHVWRVPWISESGEWDLGTARHASRVYRFKGGGRGTIRFTMQGNSGTLRYDSEHASFPYNQLSSAIRGTNPIEDIRLACAVTPGRGKMLLRLSTTARLDQPQAGIETLEARLSREGDVSLFAITSDGAARELMPSVNVGRLKPGIATEVELWMVDDEASVWIDGKRVLAYPFDLSWDQIASRAEQTTTPIVRIGLESDDPVELRRVELDRDIYYFAERYPSTPYARAEGRRVGGTIQLGENPLELRTSTEEHDAEYFVLGDNQPASEDGRGWSKVDGWVKQRYFDGAEHPGVVPGSLLVGRAFMVYYPAPHGLKPHDKGLFPNFGRLRFVH